MPKSIDYPRSSLRKSIEIAKAVSELGGSCTLVTCAEHLKKQVSGSFNAQVAAANKFGFITSKKGVLHITDFFKKLDLAYNEEERIEVLRKAFFNIPLFSQLYQRFKSGKLPHQMLDKILVREFDIPRNSAGNIANYFVDSASEVNLLNPDFTFQKDQSDSLSESKNEEENQPNNHLTKSKNQLMPRIDSNNFIITIDGPGINFRKEINNLNDFDVINAIIDSIKTNFTKMKDEI